MLVYALDIGGSSIKNGLIDTSARKAELLSSEESVQLQSNRFSDLKEEVLGIIARAVTDNNGLTAIGISTTGSVDTKGVVVSAGHFDGYTNVSWDKIIKDNFGQIKKVVVANDGRASAWGEYVSYNNEARSHVHVVVGTGVGGGIVYNNELLLGDSGQAGYIGHIKVTPNKTITCSCGKMGCVETLASAPGIVQHFRDVTGRNDIDDFGSVISLAKERNENAIKAIRLGGYWLGIGIGNAMNVLNPTVVTVGGGVVSAANEVASHNKVDLYFDSVTEGVKYASHKRAFASCDVRKAIHGNDGGLIGAAYLCASAETS